MSRELTLFYVADIHGSDRCFRKWLNAGRHYGADVLVIGGDLTGKQLLPFVPAPGPAERWTATWHGRPVVLETKAEVDELARTARDEGTYPWVTTPDEVAEVRASLDREREVFARLKTAALAEWVRLADERLAAGTPRAFVMAGNDDPPEIDAVLESSRCLVDVQGRAVELAPGIWMASRGESTPTPWNTPREVPDEELARLVGDAVAALPPDVTTVWNLHMPPFDSGIDRAPKLDADLRVRYDAAGEPIMLPVGSRRIRELIEAEQPTLGLHGHIHEGRGRYRLGRTVGYNPGSQYQNGELLGVLVRLDGRRGVRDATLTAG